MSTCHLTSLDNVDSDKDKKNRLRKTNIKNVFGLTFFFDFCLL
jgi:hypothetical protein